MREKGGSMKRIPLTAFATEIGQNKAAEMLGVRQSAISKAILKKRNIYVIQKSDGTIEAEEIKSFPATKNE